MHHPALPSSLHLARQCRRCPHYHRLRPHRVWSLLHHARQILQRQVEFGQVESTISGDCVGVEFVCCCSAIFAALFSRDGGYVQFLLCHFCGHYVVCRDLLVGHAGGEMVEDKTNCCGY